jgi:hypothetical protein
MKKIFKYLILLTILIILTKFIFYPAYISTIKSCYPEKFEDKYSKEWIKVGSTTQKDNSIEIKIIENLNPLELKRTIKHEYIHYLQSKSNRLYSCKKISIGRYINELEAYTGEYLPDFIYKSIYGDYSMVYS